MLKQALTLCLIVFLPQILSAQIRPKEGSELNYRLIGFSFPEEKHILNYTLEIAKGNYNSEDSFKKNVLVKQVGKSNKVIAEVPSFGSQYTWRVVYSFGKSNKTLSALFHFSTGTIPEVDTTITRLRITQGALAFQDAYVFVEGSKALYDMTGKPVWYLPQTKEYTLPPVDLKLSSKGTITFLSVNAYEVNYDGNILWKAPNDGKISGKNCENYHHEFTRLNNGNYMVLANELVACNMQQDSSFHIDFSEKDPRRQTSPFSVLTEYDGQGNIVWSWKSSKYFETSDLVNYKPRSGKPIMDIHENSFYFDEQSGVIYINCKQINRVIKIKYPEGTVINNYGDTYKPGVPSISNGMFCGEHAIRNTTDGCIVLFNNNACQPGQPSEIEKFKEPVSSQGNLEKIWGYTCNSAVSAPVGFQTGGNVTILPGNSIFVSTASPDNKIFIVNENKEILWSSSSEKWNADEKKWVPLPSYRASIVTGRQELERLMWGTY